MGRKRTEKLKIFIMLCPFLFVIYFTFILGTIEMLKQSLGYIPFLNMTEYSFLYYKEVLSDINFYKALIYTIYLSVVPTIMSVFFGTTMAIYVFLNDKKHKKSIGFSKIPIITPYFVYTFIVIILLMQTGLISRIFYLFNIIDSPKDFPLLIYDSYGIGILITYILKQTPFVFLIIITALSKFDRKYIDVSINLGASALYTVKKVILPSIKHSIFTSSLLCFAFNFGSFEVPYLLLSPNRETLPILAYKQYISSDILKRPYSMVINSLILAISIILLIKYLLYISKED